MSIFENYRAKYEESQQEILKLKDAELELRMRFEALRTTFEKTQGEADQLKQTNANLRSLLGEDEQELRTAKEQIMDLKKETANLNSEKESRLAELSDITSKLNELKNEYVDLDEAVLLQSFALYHPHYDYSTSTEYKEKIDDVKKLQATMILDEKAAICTRVWALEGSKEKGKKFESDNIKQILRSFNIECDDIIRKVKFSNYDVSKKKIQKAFDLLNKLNNVNKILITDEYLNLKFEELNLTYEYAEKKQEEKEELRRQRELHKEELRLAKEIEEKRYDIEKEQQHYNNALTKLEGQMAEEKDKDRLSILVERREEIVQRLLDLDIAIKDIDYREANQRAGYVYIISNIGAFGENIYKIGMTRRLEPQERIDELSGASVPFKFDIHALIFSDDAPGLEAELHREFEDKKVNMVNGRKEFFNVTLREIEEVVRKYHDKTVEFKYVPDAQQYRETLLLQKSRQ